MVQAGEEDAYDVAVPLRCASKAAMRLAVASFNLVDSSMMAGLSVCRIGSNNLSLSFIHCQSRSQCSGDWQLVGHRRTFCGPQQLYSLLCNLCRTHTLVYARLCVVNCLW